MGLNSSLSIARSGLAASQAGIAVTGNNLANASTPGYSRQVMDLVPTFDARQGRFFTGRGVEVAGIRRQVDTALQARLWNAISDQASSQGTLQQLSTLESLVGGLSDNNVSTQLGRFFDSFSELANTPAQAGARSLAIQRGSAFAQYLQQTSQSLNQMRTQTDRDLATLTERANGLLSDIARLNSQIVTAEAGQPGANNLRDQREQLVTQLSELMDVSAVEQPNGNLDILVGSTPVVLAGNSRGVQFRVRGVDPSTQPPGAPPASTVAVVTGDNGEALPVSSGRIGALLAQRSGSIDDTLARLDSFTQQLIFQVNRLHSQGEPSKPQTVYTGQLPIRTADNTVAFNDPANQTFAALPFRATSGSFQVTVTDAATGASQTRRITVDLDGLTSSGAAGFADDTSPESLRAALSAVPNLSASFTSDGRLQVSAAQGFTVSFSEDTSGVLATTGLNTFFTGTSAADVAVRQDLIRDPSLLAVARSTGGSPSANGTALGIAGLRDQGLSALGGATLRGFWEQSVAAVAVATSAARTDAEASTTVRQSLDAQRAAVSGVSVDEEAINLVTYQRQYQASARFITVVDELTQTLLGLLR